MSRSRRKRAVRPHSAAWRVALGPRYSSDALAGALLGAMHASIGLTIS